MTTRYIFIALSCLAVVIQGQLLPFSIFSFHYHDSFHCIIHMQKDSQLKLYSQRMSPSQDHWLTLTTRGSLVTIDPPVDPQLIIFNQIHREMNTIGYTEYVKTKPTDNQQRHFHYVKAQFNNTQVELLLPSFHEEMRAIRIDQLYKCSQTLVSVNWIDDIAHVLAFSAHDEWILIDNVQGGFAYKDRGILYGYAIDKNFENYVKIRITYQDYCLIDRNTQRAKISLDWQQSQTYNLSKILSLVQKDLPIISDSIIINNEL